MTPRGAEQSGTDEQKTVEDEDKDEDAGSSSSETRNDRDHLVNPYWIDDRDLKGGVVDFLNGTEIAFWKDLIEKYLAPINSDAKKEVSSLYLAHSSPACFPSCRWQHVVLFCFPFCVCRVRVVQAVIAQGLRELRDRSVFFFMMINAIFIIIVFLMQLNKEQLHIKWPFGIKTNVTLTDNGDVRTS